MNDAAAVRGRILDALRLDLVGPRPGESGHDGQTTMVTHSKRRTANCQLKREDGG